MKTLALSRQSLLAFFAVAVFGCCTAQFTCAEESAAKPTFLATWGERGDMPGQFFSPISISISANDEVYVTDLNNARLQKFSSDGKYIGGFDLPHDAPPRKSCMIGGMAVDNDGHIYLSYMIQHKVVVYSETGEVIREWGKKGNADGEFFQPGGIIITPDNTIVIADQCNHRVQKFTPEGTFVAKWGEHGEERGKFGGPEPTGSRFAGPHFLALDTNGQLYTTEGVQGRVQQLTLEGKPLLAWGNKSDDPGGFGAYNFGNAKNSFGPIGIFADKHNRIWVSSLNHRVQCFTPEGKYLFGVTEEGSKEGQLDHPHGISMDSHGILYIADSGNQRIQKFNVPMP